ncbi:hypothetical protein R3P38DRAFT_2868601 [Favolaschia claudopus]|uniref:F-box domain-containing protein n=1 Tax=Favolaschia claudopus TaxID=2862362 RepID=A0AAW0D6S3_9AGAR
MPPCQPSSPFDSLPVEILEQILVLCTTNAYPLANLTLRRVSKLWLEVSESSPRIWQHIFLDDRCTIASAHVHATMWAHKSYPMPFDVHLHVSQSSDLILPLLSPILPQLSRWRTFTMAGKRTESTQISNSFAQGIDGLIIDIQDPDQFDPGEPEDVQSHLTFTSTTGWTSMNIWVSEIPSTMYFAPLHFTTLIMTEYSVSIFTQPRTVLGFLTICPMLEEFHFSGLQHDDERLLTPLPMAYLPYLRVLHLHLTCGTRSLLSSIDAPTLVELRLSHLNVDFQLASAIAERGSPRWEDGDSDDEANDFSRSKFSDHATGMGLRCLLRRSNPPLKILTMDWADMRTKDFTFVFSHVQTLETFFIEASDMSDKVIELLRPYVVTPNERPTVRLPRLSSLELSNCHELSGDALLSVLSERIRLTDKHDWDGETLQELTIKGCDGFLPSHAALLRRDFRQRLRLGEN